ncbi:MULTISPECIES: DedA family protein [Arthrobacter]|uniref:DedA family protein n=2 Tax=Arthrobacter TaxID=1663 RepID=A0ABU9KKL7_9MICC|nr:DedA family protein [Arthrobacter sp. YJM1]MDP5227436.1 DedA family protein [Arthrobacter sp. YJM1]
MDFLNLWLIHAASQPWLYPVLLIFFFVDGFATILPSETALVALSALSLHSGEPNLVFLALTALVGAMAGDNTAYLLGRKIGTDRWKWMRRPRVQKMFEWARYELTKRGAVLIFTARYIPWGRVAVNYVAGQTGFKHRKFFALDAFACLTWVGYSMGIGLLAGRWVHHNPLLGVGIAVGFALVLGFVIDHALRWWHKRKGDAEDLHRPVSLKKERLDPEPHPQNGSTETPSAP